MHMSFMSQLECLNYHRLWKEAKKTFVHIVIEEIDGVEQTEKPLNKILLKTEEEKSKNLSCEIFKTLISLLRIR